MLKTILTIALAIVPLKSCLAYSDQACLATAVYMEARGESVIGQRAVMDTILNRVKHSGRSICGVVLRPFQFSWTSSKPILPFNAEMRKMMARVRGAGAVLLNADYRWFFHKRLNPAWARKMKCVIIEHVKFCREEPSMEGSRN